MDKVPYSKYSSIYDIACGMKGEKGFLLSANRAIFAAICGVLSVRDETRKQELLGYEAYKEYREILNTYDLRSSAEQLRKEYFATSEKFENDHYLSNGINECIGAMFREELQGRSVSVNIDNDKGLHCNWVL